METIETDHLVVGAGATGMAYIDALIAESSAEVVLVDRRRQPGGHWVDAYPFVRLHQPSAYYGVNSLSLGNDRIESSGAEAGFYERASGVEVCDYYQRVLDEHFLPSGQVRFLGATEYSGEEADGHVVVSRRTGQSTKVVVRGSFVDAAYVESAIPAKHEPPFAVDPNVTMVTPNELANVTDPSSAQYAVLGAGKTAMDVVCWLLENGTSQDNIIWVRPRDGWFVDRGSTQPLEKAAAMLEHQSRLVEAAVDAESGFDLACRMEANGMMHRIDTGNESEVFRGAAVSTHELELLRTIERVVRLGTVQSITPGKIHLIKGETKVVRDCIHVDCTAPGLSLAPPRPIFSPARVTPQITTMGIAPWSAALIGYVSTLDLPLDEKNRLCTPLPRDGTINGFIAMLHAGLKLEVRRRAVPEIAAWNATARLNPGRGIRSYLGEPAVQASMARLIENFEPAIANLGALTLALAAKTTQISCPVSIGTHTREPK